MKKILSLAVIVLILTIFQGCNFTDINKNSINSNLLTENSVNRFNDYKKEFDNIDFNSDLKAVVYGETINLPINDIHSIENDFLELAEKNIQKYQTKKVPEKFVGVKNETYNNAMNNYKYFLEKCKDITVITDLEEFKELANNEQKLSLEQEQKYYNYVYSIMRSYVKTAYLYSNLYDMLSTQMDVSFFTIPYLALYETANSIYYVDSIRDLSELANETSELADKAKELYDVICKEAINSAKYETTTQAQPTVYTEGMYKVGVDIPAGEYIAYPISNDYQGYFCISSDANQKDIITNDNFGGQRYLSITSGQYLELTQCKIYKND